LISRYPGVDDLLDDYGEWMPNLKCSCCGNKKVFQIRFGEEKEEVFYACQRCDRVKGKA
jgi:DNA-directed RNA polymerase subunit M/transcription elongation factor TFIIS